MMLSKSEHEFKKLQEAGDKVVAAKWLGDKPEDWNRMRVRLKSGRQRTLSRDYVLTVGLQWDGGGVGKKGELAMKNQVVFTVSPRVSFDEMTDKDSFTFCPERGWKWAQKTALWVLKKIGCYRTFIHETVKSVRFDGDDLIAKIIEQERTAFELCGYRPSMVYMGRVDFMNLAKTLLSPSTMFSFPTSYEIIDYGRRCEVRGMPITVVPWMDGVLVVPK